jgi:hypothetical protein
MWGRAIALAAKNLENPYLLLERAQNQGQAVLREVTRANSDAALVADRIKLSYPYLRVALEERSSMPLFCPWDQWEVQDAIADEIAETNGIPLWATAVYVGWERDPKCISAPFRKPFHLAEDEKSGTPMWRMHVYSGLTHPTRFFSSELEDLAGYAKRTIAKRLPHLWQGANANAGT